MGFSEAMLLRPESWLEIAEKDDEDAATALSIMMTLASTEDDETLPKAAREELETLAPDMIPHCVQHLNNWRTRRGTQPPAAARKVGRNDPLSMRIRQKVQELLWPKLTRRLTVRLLFPCRSQRKRERDIRGWRGPDETAETSSRVVWGVRWRPMPDASS
jgi:hypothetical protein